MKRTETQIPALFSVENYPDDTSARAALAAAQTFLRSRRYKALPAERRRWIQAQYVSAAAGTHPITGEPYITTDDVLDWFVEAAEHMLGTPRVGPTTLRDIWEGKRLPNKPLARAYVARKADADNPRLLGEELAVAILGLAPGETKHHDISHLYTRVERLLGLKLHAASPGHRPTRAHLINAATAQLLADMLDVDYHDVGL